MLPAMDEGMDLGDSLYYAGLTAYEAEVVASLFSCKKYYKPRARRARNLYQFSIMKGYYHATFYERKAVGKYSEWCKDNVKRFMEQPYHINYSCDIIAQTTGD